MKGRTSGDDGSDDAPFGRKMRPSWRDMVPEKSTRAKDHGRLGTNSRFLATVRASLARSTWPCGGRMRTWMCFPEGRRPPDWGWVAAASCRSRQEGAVAVSFCGFPLARTGWWLLADKLEVTTRALELTAIRSVGNVCYRGKNQGLGRRNPNGLQWWACA